MIPGLRYVPGTSTRLRTTRCWRLWTPDRGVELGQRRMQI